VKANKDLMQDIFAGLAARDGTLFLASMADDVIWENIGRGSWSRSFRGKDTVLRDLLGPLRGRLRERSRTVAHRFIADGEYVVVEARGDNVTKQGVRYDNEYCFVFHLTDGKIRHIKEYSDTALVAEALGELEKPVAAP
jgi:ketosteroid isomerase-like protein